MSGVGGAAALRQAGYTALAVQAGAPDGAVSMWDLKLAGYMPGDGAAAGAAGGCEDRHRSRSRSFNGSATAAAGTAASNTSNRVSENKAQQQQQQQLRADGPGDVEYFRQQVKPLMHMQPGSDLPELLIGTKVSAATAHLEFGDSTDCVSCNYPTAQHSDAQRRGFCQQMHNRRGGSAFVLLLCNRPHLCKQIAVRLLLLLLLQEKLVLAGKVDAAEEPATAVMLAANPVKLAQQRKRSANGAAAAAAGAGSGVPGSSAAGGLLSLQLPGSPGGGSGVGGGPPTAASRVRQGLEKQHTSRLRTASQETAE